MSTFSRALDAACDELGRSLDRELNSDDHQELEDKLLIEWLRQERYDELISHALIEFELQDGQAFCETIASALVKQSDVVRVERLLQGLASARENAFWRLWPKALEGHIGAIKESAMRQAHALEALASLYSAYRRMGNTQGMERVRAHMVRLRDRVAPESQATREA